MTNDVLESLRVCAAEGPCTKCHEIIGIKCISNLTRKAADSIENLLTENAALRRQIDSLTSAQEMLGKELEEVKAERDAAVADLEAAGLCDFCGHWVNSDTKVFCGKKGKCEFVWRKPQKDV